MSSERIDTKSRLETEPAEVEESLPQQEGEPSAFLYLVTSQTPWWIVSVLLHVLVITLASLVSMAIDLGDNTEPTVTVTTFTRPPELDPSQAPKLTSVSVLAGTRDTPPTDMNSSVMSEITVDPYILAQAELGDHYETINLDRPDTHSAFGRLENHSFHSITGIDEEKGGGGTNGPSLADVIGWGGAGCPGDGGGRGGGHGTGWGVDTGPFHGTYGTRDGGGRRLMVMRHGGSYGPRGTEDSVQNALHWLAYHQEPDGHWDVKKYGSGEKTDTACTGFALLAFLGAGHTEKVGEYKENVRRAVAWLKSKQQANGMIFDTTDAGAHRGEGYPHAIASLAMVEAAGMANVPETRDAAQRAINYSTEVHQCGEGTDKYGWRYHAKMDPDLSVSGWFIMSLKSAKVSGLTVNHAAFEGAIKFLNAVDHKGVANDPAYAPPSIYWYRKDEPHDATSHRLTAIGVTSRQFLGWKKDELQASVDGILAKGGVPDYGHVDLYYWYYGALCTFQQGGDAWKRWNEAMKVVLPANQRRDGDERGSWDATGDYSNEWGRVGQTALSCLCLEVYYRYLQMAQD